MWAGRQAHVQTPIVTKPTLQQVIRIHPAAPAKPALGQPCNGCGVCCLAEPCPLGVVISRRRRGACSALRWSEAAGCYRCGVLVEPRAYLPRGLGWCGPLLAHLARRWIAAGTGCDAELMVERVERVECVEREAPAAPGDSAL